MPSAHHAGVQPALAILADSTLPPAQNEEALHCRDAWPLHAKLLDQKQLGFPQEILPLLETFKSSVSWFCMTTSMCEDDVEEELGKVRPPQDHIAQEV